jgi:hypothetical protein
MGWHESRDRGPVSDGHRRAYSFFDQLVVVDCDHTGVAVALDAVYARQRAPLPATAGGGDLHIKVWSGAGARPADSPRPGLQRDRGGSLAWRAMIEVGGRTIRVPDPAQLLHYAHLVLVNAAAALVRDALVLHGGAVARHGTAVLLVGHSGSGKTTLTLELVRRGWGFLSDDFAVLGGDGVVHPFPRRVNVTAESLALLGASPPPEDALRLATFGGREKWMIDIEEMFPGRLAGPAPVGVLLLLEHEASAAVTRDIDEGGSDAPEAWLLQVDHLPARLEDALTALPGVQLVRCREAECPPVVEIVIVPGARIVAGVDEVCCDLDVSVLAARRTGAGCSQRAGAADVAATKFTATPMMERLKPAQALPHLLAHALSLSGRRFLGATSQREVHDALTLMHGALSGQTAVFRLGAGSLRASADVVERVAKRLRADASRP